MRAQIYNQERKSRATKDEMMEGRGDPFTKAKPKDNFQPLAES